MARHGNFQPLQLPFSFHKYKQGDSLHWSAHIQCKTSKMHGPTRAYLCYSCHFVTPPRPLLPDVQKHSSSLNTLHLLSRWPHHTANCIFGVPVPPERRLPLLFCRIDLRPCAPPPIQSSLSLRLEVSSALSATSQWICSSPKETATVHLYFCEAVRVREPLWRPN